MTGQVWYVRIPAPIRILSFNQDTGKGARHNRRKWREAAYEAIRDAHVPVGLDRIRVDIEIRFPAAGHRDIPNYHPTVAKPIVDALGPERRTRTPAGPVVVAKGHGVIPDDTSAYLCCTDDPHIRFGLPVGRADPRWPFGLVMLTITDLSAVTT